MISGDGNFSERMSRFSRFSGKLQDALGSLDLLNLLTALCNRFNPLARERKPIIVATTIRRDRKAGATRAVMVRGNAQIVAGFQVETSGAEAGVISSE